ncbi:hypothetical protein AVEN_117830-1 [Araneus ventricosus]|uniref:Uncharacterized protein n=1 Tax=Araneus ventricosus TaxID=182803 RepID=A0A4Y2BA96_ARAVE|nr:hypothetical protein AVEN_117830-1 [Araneus ventricosus]
MPRVCERKLWSHKYMDHSPKTLETFSQEHKQHMICLSTKHGLGYLHTSVEGIGEEEFTVEKKKFLSAGHGRFLIQHFYLTCFMFVK